MTVRKDRGLTAGEVVHAYWHGPVIFGDVGVLKDGKLKANP